MNTDPKKQLSIENLPCSSAEIGRWLWILEDTRRRTHGALEGLHGNAEGVIDWVSPVSGNSIGMVLYHLAAIEASWLYEDVLQADLPSDIERILPHDVRDSQGHLTDIKGIRVEDHLIRLGRIRDQLRSVYSEMSMEDFLRTRRLPEYDVSPEWVLHHLMQHEGEHRGQITELRLHAEHALLVK